MAEYSVNEKGLPHMVVPYAEMAAARLPGGVDMTGAHGIVAFILLAWDATGRPGLPPQGDWDVRLEPDGDSTRFHFDMTAKD